MVPSFDGMDLEELTREAEAKKAIRLGEKSDYLKTVGEGRHQY